MKAKGLIIRNFLKRATLEDLFIKGRGDAHQNKEVFYKSEVTGKFEGPYFLCPTQDYLELMYEWTKGMVYVLDFTDTREDSLKFGLRLKEATSDDVINRNDELKVGLLYYMRVGSEDVQGPYYLAHNTDIEQLSRDLKDKLVYTISKFQNFKLLEPEKIAS